MYRETTLADFQNPVPAIAGKAKYRHPGLLLQLGLAVWVGLLTPGYADHSVTHPHRRHPDFNGDGFADLAVGIPRHDVADANGNITARDAGAVNVFYGSHSGIASSGAQMWTQDTTLFNNSVRGAAESSDRFGAALAWGDFNGDGFHDLAVGVPNEKIGTVLGGAVNVLYGSTFGLTAYQNQMWHQGATWHGGMTIRGSAGTGDNFGAAIATGDFNADGYDDLAVGVPGETVNGNRLAGAVNIIYGSSAGLLAAGESIPDNRLFDQRVLVDPPEAFDQFGFALTAGDFDGDGDDDLAVGVPFETVADQLMAGAVNVIYGSRTGLTEQGNQFFHQNTPDIEGKAETGDFFGYALVVGDFVGNDKGSLIQDLVVGIPGEDVSEDSDCYFLFSCLFPVGELHVDSGAIQVIYGSNTGLAGRDEIFHQGELVAGRLEAGDFFGRSLAVGDFNGDGIQDLAVGVPKEDIDQIEDAGAVTMLLGGIDGLQAWGSGTLHQDDGIEHAEQNDRFGAWLFTGDFNGDGRDDLAVSVPREDLEDLQMTDAGTVNVIFGLPIGLAPIGVQNLVKHAVPGWVGGQAAPAPSDYFGGSGPGND